MFIGELSARTGTSARLLRYYEAQGLLSVRRAHNGYRIYGDEALVRVRQIRVLLDAGLSTEAIRDVLPCAYGARPELVMCPALRELLDRRLAAVNDDIARLERTRRALTGLGA